MLLCTTIIVLLTAGSFQEIHTRDIFRKGSDFSIRDEVKLRFKRHPQEVTAIVEGETPKVETDPAKLAELAANEKHRKETIEIYRREAADRLRALTARLKNGNAPEAAPTTEDEEKPKKIKKKTTTTEAPFEDFYAETTTTSKTPSGCGTVLGALGCLLG